MDALKTILFEDPFYLYLLLGLCAVVSAGMWYSRRSGKWLVRTMLFLLAGAGAFAVERAVVTDRERILAALDDIVRCVRAGDVDSAGAHLDEKFTGWGIGSVRMGKAATILAIKGYHGLYTIQDVRYLGQRPVKILGDDHAEGAVQTIVFYGREGSPGRVALACKLEWIKRPEGWRIRRAERSDNVLSP